MFPFQCGDRLFIPARLGSSLGPVWIKRVCLSYPVPLWSASLFYMVGLAWSHKKSLLFRHNNRNSQALECGGSHTLTAPTTPGLTKSVSYAHQGWVVTSTVTMSGSSAINPYNPEIFLFKPWRPKGFFNLKSSTKPIRSHYSSLESEWHGAIVEGIALCNSCRKGSILAWCFQPT